MKITHTKNRILVFVLMIFTLSFVLFFYIFYTYEQDNFQNTKAGYFEKIRSSYENNLQRHLAEYYSLKAKQIISNEQIVQALYLQDTESLLQLTRNIYIQLKTEDTYVKQFHFHLSDGTNLLRVHNPELDGDKLIKLRPLLQKATQEQKLVSGFEEGLSGLSYRVIVPAFYKGKFIGTFEIGVSPKKILDMVTFFNKIEGILIVKDSANSQEKVIQYKNIKNENLISLITKNLNIQYQLDSQIGEEYISMYSFDIENIQNKMVGKFIFFNNITQEYNRYNQTIRNLIVIFFISLIMIFLIINFGFNLLVTKLEKAYNDMQKYIKLIDENIITSSADLEGNITYVSEAFCTISGYSKKELMGKNHRIIRHVDMRETLYEDMWKSITEGKTWRGEIKNRKKDGGYYWVEATIAPIYDELGEKIGYTAIRQDITDKKLIEQISITDGLTNIFNRRHFNETFPKVIQSAKRDDEHVCFLLMDIDHFKQYNDNYGHQMGDEVLIKFAACLKQNLKRADDSAYRLGGEEFGIVYKADDKDKALEFANSVRQSIEELQMTHEYSSASKYVTASMGLICKKASEIKDMDEVFKQADDLLYKSKESGRNKVSIND